LIPGVAKVAIPTLAPTENLWNLLRPVNVFCLARVAGVSSEEAPEELMAGEPVPVVVSTGDAVETGAGILSVGLITAGVVAAGVVVVSITGLVPASAGTFSVPSEGLTVVPAGWEVEGAGAGAGLLSDSLDMFSKFRVSIAWIVVLSVFWAKAAWARATEKVQITSDFIPLVRRFIGFRVIENRSNWINFRFGQI
jgi:hypothetical protein